MFIARLPEDLLALNRDTREIVGVAIRARTKANAHQRAKRGMTTFA
jgi:hypothetical protein